jgi:hypothetical protein
MITYYFQDFKGKKQPLIVFFTKCWESLKRKLLKILLLGLSDPIYNIGGINNDFKREEKKTGSEVLIHEGILPKASMEVAQQ